MCSQAGGRSGCEQGPDWCGVSVVPRALLEMASLLGANVHVCKSDYETPSDLREAPCLCLSWSCG